MISESRAMSHNRLFSKHACQISRPRQVEKRDIRYRTLVYLILTRPFLPLTEENSISQVWKAQSDVLKG